MKKRRRKHEKDAISTACLHHDTDNDTGGSIRGFGGSVAINETNFPDASFRTYVKTFDKNSDGSLSESEIAAVTEISCANKSIGSLEGVENFTNVVKLDCRNNSLTSLDVSNCADLTSLNVSDNNLTTISVSNNYKLNFLDIRNNNLTSLNLSNNTNIEGLNSAGNTYDIIPDSNRQFNLSNLAGALSVSKTSSWSDGTTNTVKGKWQITKADPEYTVPTGLSGVKGKTLWTVGLPEGLSWMDGNTVMNTAGEQIFKAKYIPEDTKNYNTIENIDVKVNVAVPNISDATIKLPSAYTYTGKSITPAVTVTDSGKKLVKNTDYTVSCSKNKYVGTAKVTIRGTGAYTGTVTKTFKINPTKVTVRNVKRAGSGKMKVTWQKHSTQTTGFQIQYGTSSTFKNVKTTTVSGSKATTKTIKKLKKGKKYYVRVRAYKTVNKVKYYSSWSSKKYVKIK